MTANQRTETSCTRVGRQRLAGHAPATESGEAAMRAWQPYISLFAAALVAGARPVFQPLPPEQSLASARN